MNEPSPAHLLAKLSAHHLEVLALVAEHRSSKEIARELGISPDTVDQRLKRVKVLTGVSGRSEAARLYTEALAAGAIEVPAVSGKPVYQTPDLAPDGEDGNEAASPGNEDRTGGGGQTLHQPQAAYTAALVSWPQDRPWYAGLLEASRTNDLTPLARTVCIGLMTFVALFSVAAGVSLVEGLSRLF